MKEKGSEHFYFRARARAPARKCPKVDLSFSGTGRGTGTGTKYLIYILSFILLLTSSLYAVDENLVDVNELFTKGIDVQLREPEYCEGILKTTKGGVITGPDMRIQARNITYTRKVIDDKPCFTIVAEEDVLLEFGEFVFVGNRLEYDFQTKTGVIYDGRTAAEPWFFGGERIELCADGGYIIYNGFATTSENYDVDWKITSRKARVYSNRDLQASDIKFQFMRFNVLWLPCLNVNLDWIFDSPIRYNFRWGGKQGPRGELIYEIFSWNRLKTFLRFDYRVTRGPGLGFETYYSSPDHRETFEAINYVARDSSIEHPSEQIRYRFQGVYTNSIYDDHITMSLTYDKLSDKYMATDYDDNDLDIEYAGMTELQIRQQETNWIANFLTVVRINGFQTINQELPTFETTWRPWELGCTGIISDHELKASYLDFKYANDLEDVHDYNSTRFEYQQRFYRPFYLGNFTTTPEVGGLCIYYGNVPEENKRLLALGMFSLETNTHLYKVYGNWKHVITPYTRYEYLTYPTSSPNDHFIFDIEDGWYRLNMLQFGTRQNFYYKTDCGIVHRYMTLNLFANAFFATETIPATIPKVYAYAIIYPATTLKHIVDTAWDFEEHRLDHFNFRTEWTINTNYAIAAEYRYRDAFDWRKADHTNFIIDSFRDIEELHDSQMSDRRDTLLVHFYYHFTPKWSLELQSRSGWNRRDEPPYTEFEVDLHGTLRSAWRVKLSYQHREDDPHRFAIYFNVGLTRPDRWKCEHRVPELEF